MHEGTAYEAEADMAELARLADELVEEIGAARRHYDEMRSALDVQATEATAEQDGAQPAVALADPPALVEDARDEEPEEGDDDAPPSVEGARLVALNLALMGVGREAARDKLCDGFEVAPEWVDEIIDDAFGAQEHDGNGNSARRRRFRRRRNGSG